MSSIVIIFSNKRTNICDKLWWKNIHLEYGVRAHNLWITSLLPITTKPHGSQCSIKLSRQTEPEVIFRRHDLERLFVVFCDVNDAMTFS